MNLYLYGGNSRTNASISVVSNNATLTVGTEYVLDISTEAVLVAVPVSNK